ncbi:MAG: YIP1 family protein [Pseudomonadota bacterium]
MPLDKLIICGFCNEIIKSSDSEIEECPLCLSHISKNSKNSFLSTFIIFFKTLKEILFEYKTFFYYYKTIDITKPLSFFISLFSLSLIINLLYFLKYSSSAFELYYFKLIKVLGLCLLSPLLAFISFIIIYAIYSLILRMYKIKASRNELQDVLAYCLGSAFFWFIFPGIGGLVFLIWSLLSLTIAFKILFDLPRKKAFLISISPMIFFLFFLSLGSLFLFEI